MKKQQLDIINNNALKIYSYAITMSGYCENADGEKVFVDCLFQIAKDIAALALEIIDET